MRGGHPSASSGAGVYTVSEPVELAGVYTVSEPVELAGIYTVSEPAELAGDDFLLTSWPSVAHTSGSVSVHFRVLPWQLLFFYLNI